ncbi:hypothetical protein RLOC_00004886 [Lonchura striata]|uniref:Uncharacterized protein n=1 Tax=Lonchura striata TaxID=40157 RepID=A0A218VCL9_9PASE|nr:hypothetical protein RLOC_00004886 [Lonchura striata domestica]
MLTYYEYLLIIRSRKVLYFYLQLKHKRHQMKFSLHVITRKSCRTPLKMLYFKYFMIPGTRETEINASIL